MKKSVLVIALLLVAVFFLVSNGRITGLQMLDLPAPPPPPGMEADTSDDEPAPTAAALPPIPAPPQIQMPITTTSAADVLAGIPEGDTIADRIDVLEQKMVAVELLPGFEDRLNNVEAQTAISGNVVQRLDAIESRVDGTRVEIDNLKQAATRPYVDRPALTDALADLGKRNLTLSVSLFVLVLFIVIGMLVTSIIHKAKEKKESRKLVKNYLVNYQKTGYKLPALRMHLRACGWDEKLIDEIIKELPK